MIQQFLAIVKNTFLESIRQPIYLVLVAVGILALIANLYLSAFTMADDNKMLLDMGMATIGITGLLIAAFVATSVLTQEIDNKTVLTVVSKPVGRPVFVLGKYAGVTGAILVATTILSIAFLFTVRHRVMQAAKDEVDWPVVIYGFGAVLIALSAGIWCNFFYNWPFTSVTVGTLLPTSAAAWLLLLHTSKEWKFQGPGADLSPNNMAALAGLAMAMLVFCAIAIAASTRLSQVMTVATCIIVFLIGLLSDHFFGTRAYDTFELARILSVEELRNLDEDFSDDGDAYRIRVDSPRNISEGQLLYVASDLTGFAPLDATVAAPSVRLEQVDRNDATLVKVGDSEMRRVPRVDDFLIEKPAEVHMGWRLAWSLPPNFQFLLLADAVTQGHLIQGDYLRQIALYTLLQVGGLLSLAVILFQKREVG